jgi:glucose-6-phosphate isomerase
VQLGDTLEKVDPARTLFVVCSKTFTTLETLTNAKIARQWVVDRLGEGAPARHFAAVSTNAKAMDAFLIPPQNRFTMWDWVGGRYSVWSAVGLSVALALGMDQFELILEGGYEMDEHFRTAAFEKNLPVLMGLLGIWNRNFLGMDSLAVLPYDQRLHRFPAYLQQLEMESNGKRVARDGAALSRSACAVTWGAAGTNAQHSFFQLLHQGVDEIPVEFIVNAGAMEGPPSHRAKVYANALAQARALMVGKSEAQARAEMIARGMSEAEASSLAPHRTFPGNRASTLMSLDALEPEAMGALLAFYEHRTFTQAVLAGINPFDQWGVELGKEMANALLPPLEGAPAPTDLDPSTRAWVERLRS